MAQIILPAWVERNVRVERTLASMDDSTVKYWNRRLQEIDPRLALAWAGENATGPGIIPNRWHVRRKCNDGPDSYWAVTTGGVGKHGGFREMAEDVVETLRMGDLWNDQIRRAREEAVRRREASLERAKQTNKEARVDDLASNIRALERPSAVFNTDLSWTARAGARKDKAA